MTTAVPFTKTSEPIRFDKKLGICFTWFCFSKKEGEEYDDEHGDHMPDDELVLAVDKWMAKPASERDLDSGHVETGRGHVATAVAMTEDVVKAANPPIDTFGTYGIWGSFRPDAALLKAIESGEQMCVSVVGTCQPEIISKSAGEVVEKKRKRILRNLELTRLGVVKAGAHVGAVVTLVKGLPEPTVVERIRPRIAKDLAGAKKALKAAIARHARHLDGSEATDDESQMKMMADMQAALSEMEDVAKAARIAKATPALTSLEAGHQHLIHDIDEACGYTSYEADPGMPGCSHSHPWARNADGALTIGAANGHTHTLATDTETTMADDTAKSLEIAKADIAKAATRLVVLRDLPADQFAFAKRLDPAALAAFLDAPAADRTARATPIHKSERTGRVFYAGQEDLVAEVKDADALHVEIAKAKEQAEAVTFEKAATETIPNLKGTLAERAAIMKAVAGIGDATVRKGVLESLKGADAAVAMLCKAPGFGGGNVEPSGPQAELDAIAADLAKKSGSTFAKGMTDALATPRGRQLYDQIEHAKRARA